MGEVNAEPEAAARAIEDLTAIEVDPAKCERLYKAALIQSKSGVSYRMFAKCSRPERWILSTTDVTSTLMANPRRNGELGASLSRLPNGSTRSLRLSKGHQRRRRRGPGRLGARL